MKREVEREKSLPSFEIDVVELEVLISRLTSLFDDPDDVYCSIDIRLKNEALEFSSVDEIKGYKSLKGKVTNFSVWLSKGGMSITIRTNMFISSLVTVSAKADNEAWCAGAIETVDSFIASHRTWYHWFIKWPFGYFLIAIAFAPLAIEKLGFNELFSNAILSSAWLFLIMFLAVLYLTKGKFLPAAILRISNEEGYLRRKAPELSLIVALLTALLTVIGWFVGK